MPIPSRWRRCPMACLLLQTALSPFLVAGESPLAPAGESFPFPGAATLVIPAEPTAEEEFAGTLLAFHLPRFMGGAFSVVRDDKPVTGPFVSLGRTKQYAALNRPAPDLDVDGYEIVHRGGNWYLLGGSLSGPVNAASALMEEDLGCRWFAPKAGMVYPDAKAFRATPRRYVPQFKFRDPYYNTSVTGPEWAAWNRVNPFEGQFDPRYGRRLNYAKNYFTHTFSKLIPAKEFGATNPEFFPLIDGARAVNDGVQRDVLAPGLVDATVAKLETIIQQQPGANVFSVSQMDNPEGWSEDDASRAVIEAEGYAGLLLKYVNPVAEKIGARHPGVFVSTLGYHETAFAPKTMKPADNLFVMLCSDSAISPVFSVDEYPKFFDSLKSWSALGTKIQAWDYVANTRDYPLPQPNLAMMNRNIDVYREHGVVGVLILGSYNTPASSLEELKCWALAKKLWDPSRDLENLAREFVAGYYGAAAEPMQAYVDLLARWAVRMRETGTPETSNSFHTLPAAFVDEARPLLADALERAKGDAKLFPRVEREWFCLLYMRGYHGPQSTEDYPSYQQDVSWLILNQARLGFAKVHEGGYTKRFDEWRKRAREFLLPKTSPGSVRLPAIPAPGRPTTRDIIDYGGLTQILIQQPKACGGWSVQMNYEVFAPQLTVGREYLLVARYATGAPAADGLERPLFTLGSHTWGKTKPPYRTQTTVRGVPGRMRYQALARVVLEKPWRGAGMFYTSGHAENPAPHVYYDTFELVPADEYAGEIPADLPEIRL